MITQKIKTTIFEWSVAAVSLLLLSTAYAYSAEIPQLKSYVNDYANILPENYRHDLNERLHNFEVNSPGNPQIVVVTVPNTGDESIEDYANKTFHQNKIGHTNNNNGVLTVISMDHKIRIEVGYDLEPTLTDSKSHDIIDVMKPSLKAGNFSKALNDEMVQLFPVVNSGSAENVTPSTVAQNPQSTHHKTGFPFMSLIFLLIVVGVGIYLYRKFASKPTNTDNSTPSPSPVDVPLTSTYVPPASPNYTRSQPTYAPRSTVYNRPGPFTPRNYDYEPPVQDTYVPPSSQSSSTIKSAAAGALGGFAASELLNSGNRRRNDDDSSSSSSSWSSPSDSSSSWSSDSSSSSSSDSGYSGGGGDSGGAGSSDSW